MQLSNLIYHESFWCFLRLQRHPLIMKKTWLPAYRLPRREQRNITGGAGTACLWTCPADGREYSTFKKCKDNCPVIYTCELVC
jgi:hypothetical protein